MVYSKFTFRVLENTSKYHFIYEHGANIEEM
jgi:hypothetical protein